MCYIAVTLRHVAEMALTLTVFTTIEGIPLRTHLPHLYRGTILGYYQYEIHDLVKVYCQALYSTGIFEQELRSHLFATHYLILV